MAIVEMQKMALLAIRDDREPILRALQRLGCSEVREIPWDEAEPFRAVPDQQMAQIDQQLSRVQWAIGQLGKFAAPAKGMLASFAGKSTVEPEQMRRILQAKEDLLRIVSEVEDCERQRGAAHTQEARVRAAREQLLPWEALDIPLERLGNTAYTSVRLIALPLKAQQAFQEETDKLGQMASVHILSTDRSTAYCLLIHHAHIAPQLEAAMKAADASMASLPAAQGTVKENLRRLEAQLEEIEADRARIAARLKELAANLDDLKILHDIEQSQSMRDKAVSKLLQTEKVFYLEGWVPQPQAALVEAKLKETSPTCTLDISSPAPDEKPPTLLRNASIVTPFESIVAGFSLPDPKGLDPTFIMTPFFACFFGMMVSDAGYGLILALLIPLIIFLVKPKGGAKKLMWVLAIGGIFTVLWGFLFNTWFGTSPLPVFLNPMEQPLEMMGLCLGLGVVHLFTAMGIAAYINLKRGDVLAAVVDQFCWVALLCGLGLMALPSLALFGKVLAIAGFLGILLFAGRAKTNFFSRILSGLGSLYGISGWLGDILSYSRLFGMGLATGVIGMVINMLAGMVMGAGPIGIFFGILVLLVGHGFNMAINVLGAYVHACRLQYIEFFNKFYEDGGVPFKPLHGETRYVNLSKSDI